MLRDGNSRRSPSLVLQSTRRSSSLYFWPGPVSLPYVALPQRQGVQLLHLRLNCPHKRGAVDVLPSSWIGNDVDVAPATGQRCFVSCQPLMRQAKNCGTFGPDRWRRAVHDVAVLPGRHGCCLLPATSRSFVFASKIRKHINLNALQLKANQDWNHRQLARTRLPGCPRLKLER
jgi:hypothetical protein